MTVEASRVADIEHHSSLESRLLAFFGRHRLSPAQRRIAGYLTANPQQGAFLSSVDLSDKVGVSQPSVTRLATAMGFKGYSELQDKLRSLVLRDADGSRPAKGRNKFQAAVRTEIHNLEALEILLSDPERIVSLSRELARSTPLVVLGSRASRFLASYFAYFAVKIHTDVRLIEGGGSLSFDSLSQARQAGGRWILAFLVPRYPREILPVLRYARSIGFQTGIVAERVPANLKALADEVFSCSIGGRLVFDSYAAYLLLASAVLEAMSDAAPAQAQGHLEEYERMVQDQSIFLAD